MGFILPDSRTFCCESTFAQRWWERERAAQAISHCGWEAWSEKRQLACLQVDALSQIASLHFLNRSRHRFSKIDPIHSIHRSCTECLSFWNTQSPSRVSTSVIGVSKYQYLIGVKLKNPIPHSRNRWKIHSTASWTQFSHWQMNLKASWQSYE